VYSCASLSTPLSLLFQHVLDAHQANVTLTVMKNSEAIYLQTMDLYNITDNIKTSNYFSFKCVLKTQQTKYRDRKKMLNQNTTFFLL